MSGDMASLERPFEKRLSPLLPTLHIRVGRKTMLKENNLTARSLGPEIPSDVHILFFIFLSCRL
jgi:hypothetical protein